MDYDITIHPDAAAEVKALPRRVQRQIARKIRRLANGPRRPPAKPLRGPDAQGLWRIRSGDYRVVYQIRDRILTVLVVRIRHRKDAYRGL